MANTTITSSSPLAPPIDERNVGPWLVWALLAVLGLLGFVGLLLYAQRQQDTFSSTQAATIQFQSSVNNWVSQSLLGLRGDAQSLEDLGATRNQVRSHLSLLQQGGRLPDDRRAVMSLNAVRGVPIDAVLTQVDTFDRSIQPVLASSEVLLRSAKAEQVVRSSLGEISTISSKMGQSNALSTGVWGNALTPLRQDLSRREIMASATALTSGPAAASAWVTLFKQRATEAQTLANLAARDQRLSADERQQVVEWAKLVSNLAVAAEALAATADERQLAVQSLDAVQTSGVALKNSTQSMATAVQNLAAVPMWLTYAPWVALALAGLGVLGLIRALWKSGYEYWKVYQDNARSVQLSASVERLTKDLRKIMSLETGHDRLPESPESPIFALISLINKSLSQRSAVAGLIEEHGDRLRSAASEVDILSGKIVQHQNQQRESVGSIHLNLRHFLELCHEIKEKVFGFKSSLNAALDVSHRGEGVTQENLWQMESLRENTQSTSKRIKRLGENAQNISVSADVIKDISRKIKMLALNVAIEAASHGEEGRGFAGFARELERLAQTADQAVKDIDQQIDTIQGDSKETVSSMEVGTADVVKCAQLTVESGTVFKDLARRLERVMEEAEQVFGQSDDIIVTINKEITHISALSQSVNEQEDLLRASKQQNEPIKSTITSLRNWLHGLGRDI